MRTEGLIETGSCSEPNVDDKTRTIRLSFK
jgi:hypothetical protein